MAVLETNTTMGLIVAAPTAGSSGVLPGLLLALQEEYHLSDSAVIDALFNAGAIGYLAMRNATVAGAVGGCQAFPWTGMRPYRRTCRMSLPGTKCRRCGSCADRSRTGIKRSKTADSF